ncbi:ABC transporter permease [Paenibacillus eucommiae]|uniref:Aldouronate transport system permease protein n=1 Tax=Paenibacillus eucommiae TaxID=1355755 RepID=A0ABS4IMN7_9BACL|nr:ABC transporter permease subunit [Paenibacillus eucommiae]MBP1988842.1 putative aldouronate transport system permease protein [Paenibacillus eucommiae]
MKTRTKNRIRKTVPLYVLLAPAMVALFLFNYMPMYGIIIAFQDYSVFKGVLGSDWVGWKHFSYFLHDRMFWVVMKNTLIINFYDLLFGFTSPIVFALLVSELYQKKFKKLVQTISYLPHFLSWVVVSGIMYQILSPTDGLFNKMLVGLFHIEPIHFMMQESTFRSILVIADIWKGVGWSAILYFAVIVGIDKTLYEAAWIDGAGRVRQLIHITLPHLVPMIVLLLLLRLSSMFGIGFERVFLLQNAMVYEVSDVISTYIYRIGLVKSQYSLTTAIGLTQSVLGFLLLVSSNRAAKKTVGMGLY